ncbi:MAG: coenzyme F420-0:L-glutamate ligase [Candidatus Thorarchaeota archaeon]|nr:MAG: coenzyme F420-0:L-glutamate ligase [Candidatus Thorarchaeota archaeon]RLI56918.1 MAG: coenzyme F420-0:L-glutamate ligase [Candidatus Thorarchaeota archaeon]
MTRREIRIIPVRGIPLISPGDDLASYLIDSMRDDAALIPGDILVVTHSVVSVAENSLYGLDDLQPSNRASSIAARNQQDPRRVEAALREASDVLRETPVLITRTRQGVITDYSGIDSSNAPRGFLVALPKDPDMSARRIAQRVSEHAGFDVPVIITDTQGRPWRKGAVNVAIGLSGISPLLTHAGERDMHGRTLRGSVVCVADEIASMAELVMGQSDEGIPAVIVRGVSLGSGDGTATQIYRDERDNLFK